MTSQMFPGYFSRGSIPPAFISLQTLCVAQFLALGPKFAHAHWGRHGNVCACDLGYFKPYYAVIGRNGSREQITSNLCKLGHVTA